MSVKYQVDGIIFDLGSTLLEYENIPWVTLNLDCLNKGYEFLSAEGLNPPHIDDLTEIYIKIREKFRLEASQTNEEYNILEPLEKMLLEAGIVVAEGMTDKFFEAYYQPICDQLSIYGDTITVLDKIKKSGKKIGLVSNTIFPESYHQMELDRFNITRFFDFTIFSSSFGYRKPSAKIYSEAVKLIGIPAENLLFVGDRFVEDYRGPREYGMNALIKYREGREYPDPMPEETVVIRSLCELLPLIGIDKG